MTQEEKAKAYDEALERARQFSEHPLQEDSANIVEYIFPELKESEDEQIRKALICHLQKVNSEIPLGAYHRIQGVEIDDILTWLEKQGASIDVDSILNKVGIQPAYKDGNAWCILYGDNLQDGICGFGDTKENALVEFIKELLEKQSEQKFVDKVEPKFKESMTDYERGYIDGRKAMAEKIQIILNAI